MTTLRVFHRTTAIIVVIFVVAHLSNHLAALASLDAHQRLMDQLRLVYREPLFSERQCKQSFLLPACLPSPSAWFIGTKGRHPGWIALSAVAALIWFGVSAV